MDNEIEIFNYLDTPVRVATVDDEPWWLAGDICDVLGIRNVSDAMLKLDDDEKRQVRVNIGQTDVMRGRAPWYVSESGLYTLILRSDKPEAREFKRWVTHEVLPTIRKTGSYAVPQRELSRKELAYMVIEAEERAEIEASRANYAEGQVVELSPKADRYDHFMSTEENKSLREVARMVRPYGIRERHFIDDLLREDWGWIEKYSTAAKVYPVDRGYMVNRTLFKPSGETFQQGLITKKGIDRVFTKLGLGLPETAA